MKDEYRMEQHYAVSTSGLLVHIAEAHLSNEDFYCPHCKCRMLKKCGTIRSWHFAHDYRYQNENVCNCSYESYLHAYAKLRLKQWFDESPQIILHYQQKYVCKFHKNCKWLDNHSDVCCTYKDKSYNVKKCLTQCLVEENVKLGDNSFRADLLWSNPKNPQSNILIEIKVTHECTQKKKDSNLRIIEFDVHSEEDVDAIVNNEIRENDTVRYYGFNPQELFSEESVSPKFELAKFILYKNNSVFARSLCNCQNYRNRRSQAQLEVTVKYDSNIGIINNDSSLYTEISIGRFYNWGLAIANNLHCQIRNCYMCSAHKYDYENGCLYCNMKNIKIDNPKIASICETFHLNDEFDYKNLEEVKHYAQFNPIDIWVNNHKAIKSDDSLRHTKKL